MRQWIFENALPNVDDTREVIATVNVLTLPSKRTLDQLTDDFSTLGSEAYEMFLEDLKGIGDGINQRNAQNKRRGRAVYPYLHPSVVPASIDI